MPDSAIGPVSAAIFARLNVASLKAAVPTGAGCLGGVTDNPPQTPVWPFLWYELSESDLSGLGDGPATSELQLRLHVFSQYQGAVEEQRIMREAIRLLKFTEPTVVGYQVPKINRPHDPGIQLPFEELNGVKCREFVSIWTVFADEVVP